MRIDTMFFFLTFSYQPLSVLTVLFGVEKSTIFIAVLLRIPEKLKYYHR